LKILEKVEEKDTLRVLVDSNEESLFFLLKAYLEAESDVDIVGVYKEHYLINKTEILIKVKKGNALEVFNKSLAKAKKDLLSKKVK
jgi:DNA-directed RNA polymerase subunit L